MKTYDETINAVLKRRDAYEAVRQKRNKTIKRTIIPLTFSFAVVFAVVGLWQSGIFGKEPSIVPTETTAMIPTTKPSSNNDVSPIETTGGEKTESPTSTQSPVSSQPDPEGITETPDGEASGGEIGYFFIPALPQNREIVTTGEKITDEEAAAYFAEHRAFVISALSSSGVAADNVKISDQGYSHVSYNGTQGERLTVRENFRDYLVYNGDALVAIITLYKENGTLYDTPMFGAAWFDAYNAFLREYKGEALVYIYAGQAEIILTPQGSMYAPLGYDPTRYMDGIEDPYHLFYHPGNVFVP